MSDQDKPGDVSGFGDPREEALWEAYQALLRRRKAPRPRWSALESAPMEPPEADTGPYPVAPEQRAAPTTLAEVEAPPRLGTGRTSPRRAAAAASVFLAAGAAALAFAYWPRGPTAPGRVAAGGALPTIEASLPVRSVAETKPPEALAPHLSADTTQRPRPPLGLPGDASPRGTARPWRLSSERSFAARTPKPRLTTVDVAPHAGHGADPGGSPVAEVSSKDAAARAVREFYEALGQGDGARAAAVVIPEKREAGPLSAAELTRFYSSLHGPLRITKLEPINDGAVFVRYHFVTADNHVCLGSATVDTTRRDGDVLVQRIRPFTAC
jgi:hypothetical protein